MRLRILLVLFMVSLTLLSGGNADATTINLKFKIDEIILSGNATNLSGGLVGQGWSVGDTFNISISHDPSYWFDTNATLSSPLVRKDFGFDSIAESTYYYKSWYWEVTAWDEYVDKYVSYERRSTDGKELLTINSPWQFESWDGFFMFTDETSTNYAQISVSSAPIPEPSTLILLGSGLVGLIVYRKKRQG